ncbi:MAG: sigma-70 family RNA polymerase sigma factor [Holophagales bacterium]|nr:sigma-70 family RNA polymerase sigma factor [Holophagales bacterium]
MKEARQSADRSEPASLGELVAGVSRGDTRSEGELVERFSRGLRAYLRRLGCAPELVDDLHQETFRVVLERLRGKGIEDPDGLAGFLRGTARRLHLGMRRKAARRRTEPDPEAIAATEDPRSGQLHQMMTAEAASMVRRLLAELEPPRDREILYRFYIAEDQKEAICRDFQLSSLHFNRVIFRARQRFRQLLEAFEKPASRPSASRSPASRSSASRSSARCPPSTRSPASLSPASRPPATRSSIPRSSAERSREWSA